MAVLTIDRGNELFYLHTAPERDGAPTFVFVNALTGTTDHWEAVVAPVVASRGSGHSATTSAARPRAPSRPAPS